MLDDFFTRALIAGIGLALVTGPIGCFVVWRRLAYFGETIAHSALLGVALSLLLDLYLVVGILVCACVVVLLMFYLERRDTLPADTILGLLCHGSLALGLVVLSFFPNVRINLHGLLFGDILGVSRTDLVVVTGGGVVALGILWWLWRPLLAATVNVDIAAAAGLRPQRAHLVFGFLVAAVIAGAIKIVGVLLIVALLVIPAAAARRFATSPEQMAIGAAAVGIVAVAGACLPPRSSTRRPDPPSSSPRWRCLRSPASVVLGGRERSVLMPEAKGCQTNARAAALRARRARQAEFDPRIRPYLEQALRDGGGCAAAVRYLRAGGIPSPRGRPQWSRTAVWRAAKRLGIPLAAPGSGIGALGHKVRLARRGKETAEGSHAMDQAENQVCTESPD